LRKDVSRETSAQRRLGGRRRRKWFRVKHRESGLENAILQNNPMHQKIALVLQ
jgi:hypothetical protein